MYFDDPLSGKRICGQVIDTCVLLSCHVPNTQIGLNRDCLPLKESKIFFLQYVRVCSIHICFCQTSHFVQLSLMNIILREQEEHAEDPHSLHPRGNQVSV